MKARFTYKTKEFDIEGTPEEVIGLIKMMEDNSSSNVKTVSHVKNPTGMDGNIIPAGWYLLHGSVVLTSDDFCCTKHGNNRHWERVMCSTPNPTTNEEYINFNCIRRLR